MGPIPTPGEGIIWGMSLGWGIMGATLRSVCHSPDGETWVVCSTSTVITWNIKFGKQDSPSAKWESWSILQPSWTLWYNRAVPRSSWQQGKYYLFCGYQQESCNWEATHAWWLKFVEIENHVRYKGVVNLSNLNLQLNVWLLISGQTVRTSNSKVWVPVDVNRKCFLFKWKWQGHAEKIYPGLYKFAFIFKMHM